MKILIGLLSICAILTLAIVIHAYWQWLNPKSMPLFLQDADCTIDSNACVLVDEQGLSLILELKGPRPIQGLENYQWQVRPLSSKQPVQQIFIDISGINHEMGILRLPLEKNDDQWQADYFMSICSTETLDWQAVLRLNVEGQWYQTAVYFSSRYQLEGEHDSYQ